MAKHLAYDRCKDNGVAINNKETIIVKLNYR